MLLNQLYNFSKLVEMNHDGIKQLGLELLTEKAIPAREIAIMCTSVYVLC